MKSVKPGRGPSMMNGVASVFVGVFGVIWTIAAASMGAPWFFCLFGVIFVVLAIAQALYNLHNATAKRRFSAFDITGDGEEPDPFDHAPEWEHHEDTTAQTQGNAGSFCPYCGARTEADYRFCRKCGRELDT